MSDEEKVFRRRSSSILKQPKSPRQALEEVENTEPNTKDKTQSKVERRSSRRVSFADTCQVQEFCKEISSYASSSESHCPDSDIYRGFQTSVIPPPMPKAPTESVLPANHSLLTGPILYLPLSASDVSKEDPVAAFEPSSRNGVPVTRNRVPLKALMPDELQREDFEHNFANCEASPMDSTFLDVSDACGDGADLNRTCYMNNSMELTCVDNDPSGFGLIAASGAGARQPTIYFDDRHAAMELTTVNDFTIYMNERDASILPDFNDLSAESDHVFLPGNRNGTSPPAEKTRVEPRVSDGAIGEGKGEPELAEVGEKGVSADEELDRGSENVVAAENASVGPRPFLRRGEEKDEDMELTEVENFDIILTQEECLEAGRLSEHAPAAETRELEQRSASEGNTPNETNRIGLSIDFSILDNPNRPWSNVSGPLVLLRACSTAKDDEDPAGLSTSAMDISFGDVEDLVPAPREQSRGEPVPVVGSKCQRGDEADDVSPVTSSDIPAGSEGVELVDQRPALHRSSLAVASACPAVAERMPSLDAGKTVMFEGPSGQMEMTACKTDCFPRTFASAQQYPATVLFEGTAADMELSADCDQTMPLARTQENSPQGRSAVDEGAPSAVAEIGSPVPVLVCGLPDASSNEASPGCGGGQTEPVSVREAPGSSEKIELGAETPLLAENADNGLGDASMRDREKTESCAVAALRGKNTDEEFSDASILGSEKNESSTGSSLRAKNVGCDIDGASVHNGEKIESLRVGNADDGFSGAAMRSGDNNEPSTESSLRAGNVESGLGNASTRDMEETDQKDASAQLPKTTHREADDASSCKREENTADRTASAPPEEGILRLHSGASTGIVEGPVRKPRFVQRIGAMLGSKNMESSTESKNTDSELGDASVRHNEEAGQREADNTPRCKGEENTENGTAPAPPEEIVPREHPSASARVVEESAQKTSFVQRIGGMLNKRGSRAESSQPIRKNAAPDRDARGKPRKRPSSETDLQDCEVPGKQAAVEEDSAPKTLSLSKSFLLKALERSARRAPVTYGFSREARNDESCLAASDTTAAAQVEDNTLETGAVESGLQTAAHDSFEDLMEISCPTLVSIDESTSFCDAAAAVELPDGGSVIQAVPEKQDEIDTLEIDGCEPPAIVVREIPEMAVEPCGTVLPEAAQKPTAPRPARPKLHSRLENMMGASESAAKRSPRKDRRNAERAATRDVEAVASKARTRCPPPKEPARKKPAAEASSAGPSYKARLEDMMRLISGRAPPAEEQISNARSETAARPDSLEQLAIAERLLEEHRASSVHALQDHGSALKSYDAEGLARQAMDVLRTMAEARADVERMKEDVERMEIEEVDVGAYEKSIKPEIKRKPNRCRKCRVEEWTSECVHLVFCREALHVKFALGAVVCPEEARAEDEDAAEDREILSVQKWSTISEDDQDPVSRLAHRYAWEAFEREDLALTCKSTRRLRQILPTLIVYVEDATMLHADVRRASLFHMTEIQESGAVTFEFVDMDAFQNFRLRFAIEPGTYPNRRLQPEVEWIVGEKKHEDLKAVLRAVDAGPSYLYRLVDAVDRWLQSGCSKTS